jgi:hypothetical protein
MKMFEWKVEELKLINGKKRYIGRKQVYAIEDKVSREDKIAFVDSRTDGRLSYIIALCDKFESEKETLKKDSWGNIKTVSLKAWLNKNDPRKICDTSYRYGNMYIYKNVQRFITSDPLTTIGTYDTYADLVDEVFHRVLCDCDIEETKYFKEHDEYEILKKSVCDYMDRYNVSFGVHIITGSVFAVGDFENHRDFTMDELKELVSKYQQIDNLVEKLTNETHIAY